MIGQAHRNVSNNLPEETKARHPGNVQLCQLTTYLGSQEKKTELTRLKESHTVVVRRLPSHLLIFAAREAFRLPHPAAGRQPEDSKRPGLVKGRDEDRRLGIAANDFVVFALSDPGLAH